MKKSDIVQELARRSGVHPNLAAHLYDNLIDILGEELCRFERVPLGQLGNLTVTISAPHKGRHPKTKEPIQIQAHSSVRFHISKPFKEVLEQATLSREEHRRTDKPTQS